ncbi:MAG: hypothetical protein AAFY60_15685, partial [Myxococcota bacterium]
TAGWVDTNTKHVPTPIGSSLSVLPMNGFEPRFEATLNSWCSAPNVLSSIAARLRSCLSRAQVAELRDSPLVVTPTESGTGVLLQSRWIPPACAESSVGVAPPFQRPSLDPCTLTLLPKLMNDD